MAAVRQHTQSLAALAGSAALAGGSSGCHRRTAELSGRRAAGSAADRTADVARAGCRLGCVAAARLSVQSPSAANTGADANDREHNTLNRLRSAILAMLVTTTAIPLAHARQDAPPPQSVSAKQLHYVGTATQLDTLIPAYTESYAEHYDAQGKLFSSQVQYRNMQGEPIADKQLDYRPHPHAPA